MSTLWRRAGRDCGDLLHDAFVSPSSALGQHYASVKAATSLLLDAGPDHGWTWSHMHDTVSNASPHVRRAVAAMTMEMESAMEETKQCEWPPPEDLLEWEEWQFAFAADVLRVCPCLDWPAARPAQRIAPLDIGATTSDDLALLALLAARHQSDAAARYLFFLAWSPCIDRAERIPVRARAGPLTSATLAAVGRAPGAARVRGSGSPGAVGGHVCLRGAKRGVRLRAEATGRPAAQRARGAVPPSVGQGPGRVQDLPAVVAAGGRVTDARRGTRLEKSWRRKEKGTVEFPLSKMVPVPSRWRVCVYVGGPSIYVPALKHTIASLCDEARMAILLRRLALDS